MPFTDVMIINMSLSHVGHTQFIQSRTELSNERIVADLNYDPAVLTTLEDYNWGFATVYNTLGLVQTDPNGDWGFSYRYPVNVVTVRRIVSINGRLDPVPVPFTTGQDDNGRLVYTDYPDAIVECTKLVTNTNLFTAMFAEAVSWYLAGLIAPGLAKDRKQAASCFQMYALTIQRAEAKSRNESQDDPQLESEATRARA